MSTHIDVFRQFVEELRAGGPHRLALVLGSPSPLILPLAGGAVGVVSCKDIDAKPDGVSPRPGASPARQD